MMKSWARRVSSMGGAVTVVSVTDGEGSDPTRPHLDRVRRAELRNALHRLCIKVAHNHGLPIARFPVWTWHHTQPSTVKALTWGLFRSP
jgi:LmbE family N-acetylglucosaminyl deacetylase